MKAVLQTTSYKSYSQRLKRMKIHRTSQLSELVDKWFSDNSIYGLKFKCKTWNKLTKVVNKIESAAIKELLDDPGTKNVSWSAKCGCSCGCSPGFVATFMAPASMGSNECKWSIKEWADTIWVTMEETPEEREQVIEAMKVADAELEKEIENNKA